MALDMMAGRYVKGEREGRRRRKVEYQEKWER